MSGFSNLKIGTRLFVAFGGVLALMLFLGVFSIIQLDKVNQTSTEMEENWLPSSITIADINTNISDLQVATLNHLLSTDDRDMRDFEKEMDEIKQEMDKNKKRYEPLISSPEERALYETFKSNFAEYARVREQALELSRVNKNEEAQKLLRQKARKPFEDASEAVDKLVELNEKGGIDASKRGDVLYDSSRLWIVAMIMIAIGFGAMLAITITRSITRPIGEAVQVARAISEGKLDVKIDSAGKDETGQLLAAMKEMVENLQKIVKDVRESAQSTASAAEQISAGNTNLSQRTEEQASSLEETASSMEEMTSTVKQNADNAARANQMAEATRTQAEKGGQVVGQAVTAMEEINNASRKIADIIGTIDGIAFQTNLLALNAAVEAARAGEQGRGFAVVASEVRALAQRSANAAKEIKSLIEDSVSKVGAGSKLVEQSGQTLNEIVTSVKKVSDVVADIAAASNEQSSGIEQVNQAVVQMDEMTQQNAALVEEAAAAGRSLEEQAQILSQLMQFFKLGDEGKLGSFRTAQVSHTPTHAPVAHRPQLAHKPQVKAGAATARARQATHAPTHKPNGESGEWEKF